MFELIKDRQFQLWEYRVSHGSLLIRSPAGPGIKTSIDIICAGVQYLALPRHLGEITISKANKAEIKRLEEILQKGKLEETHLEAWTLQSSRERFLIAALTLKIQEHHGDIFDSPFAAL
jgi:hypothetical protein